MKGIILFVLFFISSNIYDYPNLNGAIGMKLNKRICSGKVSVYEHDYFGEPYGYSIWMPYDGLKSRYFAKELDGVSVQKRLNNWKKDKNIAFLSTAAFTADDYITPVGIATDQGRLINANIKKKTMDALIIITQFDEISVNDLNNKVKIRYSTTKKEYEINPRKNTRRFLDWTQAEKITSFQSQLLAQNNKFLMPRTNYAPDSYKNRFRRMLAIVKNRFGDVFHVVFYVKKKTTLFDAAQDIYILLRDDNKMDVISLVNLDTGLFDIQEVFGCNQNKLDEFSGFSDWETAPNYLVYYYE